MCLLKEFWIELVNYLLEMNFSPVIWQNYLSYDLSQELVGKCIFVGEKEIIRVLATMRATGCVLDVFNNTSRLAILSRCPFLAVDERSRYVNQREHEIDDLCGKDILKQYIYTFSTIITEGDVDNWRQDIFPAIVKKLENFYLQLIGMSFLLLWSRMKFFLIKSMFVLISLRN
jgi:hypothetical protein